MKGPKHQRIILEKAPSTNEPENNTKSLCDRDKSRTYVSSISCLSMKSNFSRGEPPVFSCDSPDNECECPNNTQRPLHKQKVAGQTPENLLKDHLTLEQSEESLLEVYQRQLKSSLKQKYKCCIKGTLCTSLYLTEESGELHEMDDSLTRQTVDCTELFRVGPGRGASVRTVLTTGSGGVGKSVLVHRSIVDWCENRALQHIQLLCLLPFPQLNLLQQQSWTLMELLQTFCPGLRESGLTDLSHLRLLFILDGLDQCRLPLDFSTKQSCDAEAPMPVDALLTNLMLGKLLPHAQLWITSRPAAARSIPPTLIHQVNEVRGFSSHQTEAYFLQNIQDEEQAQSVLAKVRSCAPLQSMFHLPLFCSITASVWDGSMTHMFLHFLCYHMRNMQLTYGLPHSRVSTVIQAVSRLAHQQLQRGECLFHENHVRDCGVEVTELLYSGLFTQVSTEDSCGGHWAFTFVHVSLQDFLAALFIHMSLVTDRKELPGALRDQPLFLKFLLELSLDSRVSLLTQRDIQRGFSTETLTHTLLRPGQQKHGILAPLSVSASGGPSEPGLKHTREIQQQHCAGPKLGRIERVVKESMWSKTLVWHNI